MICPNCNSANTITLSPVGWQGKRNPNREQCQDCGYIGTVGDWEEIEKLKNDNNNLVKNY